jgi:phosphohistidine phosphatase SixA
MISLLRLCSLLLLALAACATHDPLPMPDPVEPEPVDTIAPSVRTTDTVAMIGWKTCTLADGYELVLPHAADPDYVIFIFVRHAEKQAVGSDPGLNATGQARAERLGAVLAGAGLDRLFSTDYNRTRQTAAAVQARTGALPIELYSPVDQPAWLDGLLANARGQRIFGVGHSNTVPSALNYLTGTSQYANLPESEYARLYIAVSKGVGETEVLELWYE